MTRAASIVAGLLLAMTAAHSAAAAELSATAPAAADIVDPLSVQLNWAIALPTVKGIPQGAAFVGTMPAIGLGLLLPGNARLTVRRQDDTGEPVTAPAAFEVVTARGNEALIIRTGGAAALRIADNGAAIAGGALLGSAAASIGVARGGLTFTSNGPGLSLETATLMVVVQYN